MARTRYKFVDSDAPYFMTCTVVHWLPVFGLPQAAQIIIDSLKYLQQEGLVVHAWVMLENHIHLIASSPQLSKDMQRFKTYTAKQLLALLESRGAKTILDQLRYYKKSFRGEGKDIQFWQEGVHPQRIGSDEVMRQKIDYIHQNPVKRGYVEQPEHWRYSSIHNYLGSDGMVAVVTEW